MKIDNLAATNLVGADYEYSKPEEAQPAGWRDSSGWNVALPHLDYFGGKVLSKPVFVSIYYGKYWDTAQGKSDIEYLDAFAKNIVKSKYTTTWAEYGVGKGKFGGSVVATDTNANTKRVDDAALQRIVKSQIASGQVRPEDGQTVYTVFLPPGAVLVEPEGSTSRQGLGGYHKSYNDANGQKVYYAGVVYSKGNNGINFTKDPLDNITITTSHEWTEAATDPDITNGKLGWYDYNYGEVADIPLNMGMPLKDAYDYVNDYAVQKEWSNRDGMAEVVTKQPKRK